VLHATCHLAEVALNVRRVLLIGGVLTSIASVLHVGIILGGPAWYRFFGAGERMARLAAAGSLYPTIVTMGIAAIQGLWALYAFSGAGIIRRLPLLRPVLALVAAIFLTRGLLGIPAVLIADDPYMQELRGRMVFMVVTSLICVALGLCYALGAALVHKRSLSPRGYPDLPEHGPR
jgi:putative oxidoreductase